MTSPSDPTGSYGPPAGYGSYGPPPAYGSSPAYGNAPGGPVPQWAPPPQTSGNAIAALVLACCSWVVFPVIPAIIGLVLAGNAQRDIDASGGRLTGDGLLTATRWIAWLNIGLFVGGLVVFLLFLTAVFTV
jgi:hypothetical protein